MADLKKEGKVRWIGVSNFNVPQLKRAQAIAPVSTLQPPYSLLRREVVDTNAAADFATALFMGGIRALPNLPPGKAAIDP